MTLTCECGNTTFRRFKTYQKEIIIDTNTGIESEGQLELTDDDHEWSCVKCGAYVPDEGDNER